MRKRYIHIILLLFYILQTNAGQYYYWIELTDKNESEYSLSYPEEFMSARAIERRVAQNIDLDSCDLPVSTYYINEIVKTGVDYVHQSKWLNGITITTNDTSTIKTIRNFPFVKNIELTHNTNSRFGRVQQYKYATTQKSLEYERSIVNKLGATSADSTIIINDYTLLQNELIAIDKVIESGYRGKGKRIAILDTGFPYIDTDSATSDYNIIGTYNIAYPDRSVYDISLHNHGGYCLSLMTGNIKTNEIEYIGAATDSEYCLFVTEINESESLLEIDHWVRAIEMADSLGADIVSSSLGYYDMDDKSMSFSYDDMNGNVARCSRAATIASNKGMFVCVSAGNEANKPWHYITAPADAAGILSVGAVNILGYHCSFSSFGPTSDGRVKPEICALGSDVALYNDGVVIAGRGTSFAAPQISAGVAALWSAYPDMSSSEIRSLVLKNASDYYSPNDSTGYGIADFWKSYTSANASVLAQDGFIIRQSDWLTIESREYDNYVIDIYDISGRLIMTSSSYDYIHYIYIGNMPSGVYILSIRDKIRFKILRI